MINFIENRDTQKLFLCYHSVKGKYKNKCDNSTEVQRITLINRADGFSNDH